MKQLKIFISILLCVATAFCFASCKREEPQTIPEEENPIPMTTEEVDVSELADYKSEETVESQVGIIVDSWLKIVSIGESDGVLSALVRNISDVDVQYAELSVISGTEIAKFSVSTLTAGASAILKCENGIHFDADKTYHSWKITDKVVFKEKLTRHTNIFQIDGVDGIISVKNISDKDIDGEIFVYYKTVTDGIYVEGTTYRIRIDGLDKGETKQVVAQHYIKDVSRIMFVTYV